MANKSILDIKDILTEYTDDIRERLIKEAQEVAKDAANELKSTSPRGRRGKYAKGWKVKTQKTRDHVECVVHNSTDYQLTHLLEKGHLTRSGSKTKAIPHIAPVEKEAIKTYEKNIEQIIKKG